MRRIDGKMVTPKHFDEFDVMWNLQKQMEQKGFDVKISQMQVILLDDEIHDPQLGDFSQWLYLITLPGEM